MMSRVIVWCLLIGIISYDIPTAMLGNTTISEAVRQVDRDTNGLIRWGWLALWAHFFIKTWYTG
jgi:hypothetical protein